MRMRIAGLMSLFVLGLVNQVFADEVVNGRLGPGALYRLVRPTNWNGSLLLYAHGYVPGSDPVALPAEADLFVSLLVPQGFAIAFSSYSENGWAVKDGAQRTHQLLGIFTLAVWLAYACLHRRGVDGRAHHHQTAGTVSRCFCRRAARLLRGRGQPGAVRLSGPHARLVRRVLSRHPPGRCRFRAGRDRYRDRDRSACGRRDPERPSRCRLPLPASTRRRSRSRIRRNCSTPS